MDFTKLTKTELLEKVIEQQALADAIEEKDREILRLIEEKQEMVPKKVVADLRAELQKFEGAVTKEEIQKYTKELEDHAKKSSEIANQYIRAHRDLLKIFKANLDSAISHEELLSEKIK